MDLFEYSELQVKLVFAIPRGEGEGEGGGEGGGEGKGGGCVNVIFLYLVQCDLRVLQQILEMLKVLREDSGDLVQIVPTLFTLHYGERHLVLSRGYECEGTIRRL